MSAHCTRPVLKAIAEKRPVVEDTGSAPNRLCAAKLRHCGRSFVEVSFYNSHCIEAGESKSFV